MAKLKPKTKTAKKGKTSRAVTKPKGTPKRSPNGKISK